MKSKAIDMTRGSITKAIIAFALPILFGNIFQQAYNLADTAIAGHILGDNALSAIGATTSLFAFLMQFNGGLNGGFSLVIAKFFGEKNSDSLKKSIASMLYYNLILTIITLTLGFTVIKPILHLMNTPKSIFDDAYSYIFIIFLGTIFTTLYNAQANLLRALGNSKTPIVFLVISSVINIALDIIFISRLSMGVKGAALATVLAQGISGALCFITIIKSYKEFIPSKKHFKIDKSIFSEMFYAGITMAMMNCIFAIGSLVMQGAINGLGKSIIAGHLAGRRIAEMFMQPMITISAACSTFVSQNYGAKEFDRIKKAIKNSIIIEIVMSLIFMVLVYTLALPMIKLITSTQNDTIISTARQYLYINLPFYLFLGALYVLRTSIQSIGSRIPPLLSSSIELLSKIVCAFWLTKQFGYIGVCIAEPISWGLGVLLLAFCFSKAFKNIKQIKSY